MREADSETGAPALVVDLAVHGVWSPQTEALFDIRVIDTDVRSYSNQLPKDVLRSAENEKKKKVFGCLRGVTGTVYTYLLLY